MVQAGSRKLASISNTLLCKRAALIAKPNAKADLPSSGKAEVIIKDFKLATVFKSSMFCKSNPAIPNAVEIAIPELSKGRELLACQRAI